MNLLQMVLLAFLALVTIVAADLCAIGSQEIDGNWYCQAVQAIQYSNVGHAGRYNEVVHMGADGVCQSRSKEFSGPIAPLDAEVSFAHGGANCLMLGIANHHTLC
jgi:hypothetical protein